MDFAENKFCVAQQEVQSTHLSHNQVTIHPTVAYYRCTEEDCEDIVTEGLIFIYDDKTHDAAAVHEFVMLTIKVPSYTEAGIDNKQGDPFHGGMRCTK
ncbi:hypothetical protein DPMN_128138 [Dreissena polymorpha]|uniref:Uncharacterized protein n=1 Tax=Dreissena polymorpha TaxID=45954 RepID=A0A9D4H0K1_DREPO|nr:hypothetical protein DPMN_128138 [Dreissena polymorpha]